jgi:hypothetical protein
MFSVAIAVMQESESRSQEPEEKRTKSVEVVSTLSFWLLASEFWILLFK